MHLTSIYHVGGLLFQKRLHVGRCHNHIVKRSAYSAELVTATAHTEIEALSMGTDEEAPFLVDSQDRDESPPGPDAKSSERTSSLPFAAFNLANTTVGAGLSATLYIFARPVC